MRRGGCLVDHPRSHLHVWPAVSRRIGHGPDAVQRTLVARRPPRSARRFAQPPSSRERGVTRTKAIRQAGDAGPPPICRIPPDRRRPDCPDPRIARPPGSSSRARPLGSSHRPARGPARTGLRNQPVHDAWTDSEQSGWRGQEPDIAGFRPARTNPNTSRAAMAGTTRLTWTGKVRHLAAQGGCES